ncbi:MlaD family protein [Paracrocinitomix mangrovi]|uniref:MlaD family protein n=1 Tax=Paracrocinitomix mangrovi TaxID=2862509 RepID=UPI001C8E48E8|nr:MlaD family protein [Paracrocinitomix mangrovi]UKN02456.1 MlaD family protein [Paracrocinitomix mangrovi]
MRVSREFKIGILVVLSALFFFIGYNFVKNTGPFKSSRTFYAEFDQVNGLSATNDVLLNGIVIGQIKDVDLKPGDAHKVVVAFSIYKEDLKIPKETELWMISEDVVGTKVLELRLPPDSVKASSGYYEDGDYFWNENVHVAMGMDDQFERQIIPIKDKTTELVERVQGIIVKVSAFWDSSASYTIDASMYDVRGAVNRYNEMSHNLTMLTQMEKKRVDGIKSSLANATGQYKTMMGRFGQISTDISNFTKRIGRIDLKGTSAELSDSFDDLNDQLANVQKGEGSIGKWAYTGVIKEETKKIDSLVVNLLNHLTAKPDDFFSFSIFGLKNEGYQPDKNQKQTLDKLLKEIEDSTDAGKTIEYKN